MPLPSEQIAILRRAIAADHARVLAPDVLAVRTSQKYAFHAAEALTPHAPTQDGGWWNYLMRSMGDLRELFAPEASESAK